MKTTISFILAVLISGFTFAQDEKAKKILDEISVKTKAYETMIFEFTVVLTPGDGGDAITQAR
jgi:hypothetical protein